MLAGRKWRALHEKSCLQKLPAGILSVTHLSVWPLYELNTSDNHRPTLNKVTVTIIIMMVALLHN